ncbi:hypothetical protein [Streptomyces sp. NPDC058373]|uniref:hypothetical protein n=1 Tax=Streptomyces sp. NPDC058373 TaxID=3346465 RepID=UPI00364C7675
MSYPHLPTTRAAVTAVREVAEGFHRTCKVTDDIGADRVSRGAAVAPYPPVGDEERPLPHEAYVELSGTPAVQVRLFADGDASVCVEGVECHDLDREVVPAFLASVYSGLVRLRLRAFPPSCHLVVPLPCGAEHRAYVSPLELTGWLLGRRGG